MGWILGDFPDLPVQNCLLLFSEAQDSLLKGAGLDNSHGTSPKLVCGGLALVQLFNPDQDVLDHTLGQLGIVFRTLSDPCPVLDLAGYGTVVYGADEARLTHEIL